MEPFDRGAGAGAARRRRWRERAADLTEISPPVAAASIAQVHKAVLIARDGVRRKVAVKILRPGIKARFRADLESYYAGARWPNASRHELGACGPPMSVTTLDRSARLELDLRLEAASISEIRPRTSRTTKASSSRRSAGTTPPRRC